MWQRAGGNRYIFTSCRPGPARARPACPGGLELSRARHPAGTTDNTYPAPRAAGTHPEEPPPRWHVSVLGLSLGPAVPSAGASVLHPAIWVPQIAKGDNLSAGELLRCATAPKRTVCPASSRTSSSRLGTVRGGTPDAARRIIRGRRELPVR